VEEVVEHYFLFGVQLRANLHRLVARATRIEGDSLGGLGRLKATGMPLGVRDLIDKDF
jgi:hypothetical protein